MVTTDVLITDCPSCGGFHRTSVQVPPVMTKLIVKYEEEGRALLRIHHFDCVATGESYEYEVAYYRPWSRVRAIDAAVIPRGVEPCRSTREEEDAIARQMAQHTGDATSTAVVLPFKSEANRPESSTRNEPR